MKAKFTFEDYYGLFGAGIFFTVIGVWIGIGMHEILIPFLTLIAGLLVDILRFAAVNFSRQPAEQETESKAEEEKA